MMFASTRLFNFKLSPVLGVQEVLNIIEVPAFVETVLPLSLTRRGGRGEVANISLHQYYSSMSEQSPVLNIQGVLNIFEMAALAETVRAYQNSQNLQVLSLSFASILLFNVGTVAYIKYSRSFKHL